MKTTVREREYELLPRYLCGATPPWTGHMKFAATLVKEFKPRCLVELGTHYGNSYFSFCQAVQACDLDCRCFAVDHWKGETQAGNYSDSVFETVSGRNDACYKGFSTLLRMDFDEAVKKFEDESIDILHIDGFHSYDAAAHDFNTWERKVRKGGIVLFHDIAVKQEGYGVWKFWEELAGKSEQSFAFLHSNGLGVWRKAGGSPLESPLLEELLSRTSSLSPDLAAYLSYWIEPPEYRRNTLFIDGHTQTYFTPAEIYYAGDTFGFAPDRKLESEARNARENAGLQLCFSLENLPEKTNLIRLDLGLSGEFYTMEEFSFIREDGEKIDLLPHLAPERSCNLILFSPGNGALEYLALNDDPNLLFTLPEGKYKTAILKVFRNKKDAGERLRCDQLEKLAAMQAQIDNWQGASRAFEQDRDAWKNVAEQRRQEWETLSFKYHEETANYELLLKKRSEDVSQKENIIQSQQELLSQKDTCLVEKDAALSAREQELSSQRALISNQQAALVEKDAAISAREQELSSQRALISNQQAALVEKDAAISAREQELAARRAHIAHLEEVVSQRDSVIAAREEDLAKCRYTIQCQDATLRDDIKELVSRQKRIDEQADRLWKQEKTIADLEEKLARYQGQAENLQLVVSFREKEISQLKQSFYWRMTFPLRFLAGLFRKK